MIWEFFFLSWLYKKENQKDTLQINFVKLLQQFFSPFAKLDTFHKKKRKSHDTLPNRLFHHSLPHHHRLNNSTIFQIPRTLSRTNHLPSTHILHHIPEQRVFHRRKRSKQRYLPRANSTPPWPLSHTVSMTAKDHLAYRSLSPARLRSQEITVWIRFHPAFIITTLSRRSPLFLNPAD